MVSETRTNKGNLYHMHVNWDSREALLYDIPKPKEDEYYSRSYQYFMMILPTLVPLQVSTLLTIHFQLSGK